MENSILTCCAAITCAVAASLKLVCPYLNIEKEYFVLVLIKISLLFKMKYSCSKLWVPDQTSLYPALYNHTIVFSFTIVTVLKRNKHSFIHSSSLFWRQIISFVFKKTFSLSLFYWCPFYCDQTNILLCIIKVKNYFISRILCSLICLV